MAAFSQDIFNKADRDGSKALTKEEVKTLLIQLQIDANETYFNEIYKKFDTDGNGLMDRNEFNLFVRTLFEKKELIGLFKKYAKDFKEDKKNEPCMTLSELQKFYEIEQQQVVSLDDLNQVIPMIHAEHSAFPGTETKKDMISFYDFSTIMLSRWNTIMDPERSILFQVKS